MKEAHSARELSLTLGCRPKAPLPPRVRAWPVLGSAVAFLRDPQRLLLDAYRAHGPVYRLPMGPTEYTVLAGPEGSAFMTSREGRRLVTAEGVWSESARITGADPHAVMTNVEGARHAELRGNFRAGMGKTAALDALADCVARMEHAVDQAERRPAQDSVALSRALVFEQLGHAMAGSAPPAMFDAADTVLKAIVRGTRVPIVKRFPLPPGARRAARDVAAITNTLLTPVDPPRPAFVQEVLEGLSRGMYAPSDLPALMLAPFIAGLDTMAHTFAFVLYRLSVHPEWQARLRDEVSRAVAVSGSLDGNALNACEELGYFVQEVMRIHPLSPAVIRAAKEDFSLDGMRVPRGTPLLVPHTLTHVMPEIFPEPYRFDPMRFHPSRAEHRGANKFAPFGIGAHVCLGAGAAEVLLRANTASLLRVAEVKGADAHYELRVSNLSGACPVGFRVAIRRTGRAYRATSLSA